VPARPPRSAGREDAAGRLIHVRRPAASAGPRLSLRAARLTARGRRGYLTNRWATMPGATCETGIDSYVVHEFQACVVPFHETALTVIAIVGAP